ncbi:MAG: NAD(P)-dependent oxidoreductase [Terriglobia bacterium]|jgi:nucleoside-diphosphate-sugar epimerase
MAQTNSSPSNPERPKRYLITGAKGFIGAWIAKTLVESGNPPSVFDVDPGFQRLSAILGESQLKEINFIQGDVTKYADLDRAVSENGINHILHLAGLQVPGCAADPLRGAMVNVIGTLNVFEVARRRRDLVRRIVYASSAAVFGPEEFYGGETVQEGAPLLPGTHYGVFKQCNEGNARVYFLNDGIPSVGIRPWAVYGVGRDIGISSGPTKAIKAAVLRRPYVIGFSGTIDLQYVRDTARIFIRCAERNIPGAKVYTPRGSVVRVEEFIHTLEQLIPDAQGLIKAQGNKLPIAPDLDDSALRHDLGEDLRTPLEEGIKETASIFERLEREGRLETKDIEP